MDLARGVLYTREINLACEFFDLEPALIQAMIEYAGNQIPDYPDDLAAFLASQYAAQHSFRTGEDDPEARIWGICHWLSIQHGRVLDVPTVISWFYGGGPRGDMRAHSLLSGPYIYWRRRWR